MNNQNMMNMQQVQNMNMNQNDGRNLERMDIGS